MDLIYCAGGNKVLMQIAYDAGYLLGIRSDRLDYGFPITFADINYKHPDFEKHLKAVAQLKPRYAVVPDLSESEDSEEDVARAIKQADQLGAYCDFPLITPKRSGQLRFIPDRYPVAYSVPTTYGGAKYGVWKLQDRRIHLLGGSPHGQMKLRRSLPDAIQSVDGNMAQKMAVQFAKYWHNRRWVSHPRRGQGIEDLYLDCWQRSCQNIYCYWNG